MTEETKVQFRKNGKWAVEMVGRAERKVSDFFKPASGNCNSLLNDSSSYTNFGKRHSHESSKKQGQVTNSTSKTEEGDYLGDLKVEEQPVAVSPGEAYARGKSAGMSGHVPDYINTWPEELQGQFYLGMGEGQVDKCIGIALIVGIEGLAANLVMDMTVLGLRSVGFFRQATNIVESSFTLNPRVKKMMEVIEEYLDKDFKMKINKSGDPVFIDKYNTKRIRFDSKNPHGCNPHGHVEYFDGEDWLDFAVSSVSI